MKIKFILFIILVNFLKVFSQETPRKSYIYFDNGNPFQGKLESVPEAGKISFSVSSGGSRTYKKERLLIAFNDFGRYLIISSIPDSPESGQEAINNFYKINTPPENDVIFKAIPFEIIPCTIIYGNDAINYRTLDGKSASINKENILAIIRKDGSHEIVRDVVEVTPFLAENAEKFNKLVSKQEVKPEPEKTVDREEPKQEPARIVREEPKPVKTEPMIETKPSLPSGIATKPKLSSTEKEQYAKQSIDNILTFKDYLNIIGDNSKSLSEKKEAIKSALELFTPGAKIEVTSKNRSGVRTLPVETYLKNLSGLSYRSINIEYANLKFVSELSQADDGNYYGLVRGEQSFMGYGSNGKPLYSDVVEKNYKVKVESYNKEVNTIKEIKWKVLLGDVSVSQ